jgi:quercetin 2,3-dioxygenase
MGNAGVIRKGDVQVMSAGTGIQHSEANKNSDQTVKFLQIWVFPNKRNVTPRYDQITLNKEDSHNKLQQILSPDATDEGVWIHQDAWFHLGEFNEPKNIRYDIKKKGNGVYAYLLEGEATINGEKLSKRDGMGIWDTDSLDISVDSKAHLLLMDVPMSI